VLPLVWFSDINPATEENPITSLTLSLSLVAFGQPTVIFQDALMSVKRESNDNDGRTTYTKNLALLSLDRDVYRLDRSKARTTSAVTQLVQFSNFSAQRWIVTPPGRNRLVEELNSSAGVNAYGAWQFVFQAERENPAASTELSWEGTQEELFLTKNDAQNLLQVRAVALFAAVTVLRN
jgi:hypothetical protein